LGGRALDSASGWMPSDKYRYPTRIRFLAAAMQYVQQTNLEWILASLREQLLNITGVGYKIASWVARNVLDSDEIAILDITFLELDCCADCFAGATG